jgi:biopolymer transport protein ExbD
MSLIPDEELRREKGLNLAPMVDFLFLIVAILATLTVTRASLHDSELELVKLRTPHLDAPAPAYHEHYVVNVCVTAQGAYKWITDIEEYLIQEAPSVSNELIKQIKNGLLPQEKEKIKVLLHIDKNAPWESIAQVIFAVRESGFRIHPVYEPIQLDLKSIKD